MANSYYDATGTLNFGPQGQITPVIRALFGAYKLETELDSDRRAYIAELAEDNSVNWEAIGESFLDEADKLDLVLPEEADEDDGREWIKALLTKFGQSTDLIDGLMDQDINDDSDLADLFLIAQRCNDGHDLQSLVRDGCWHSDRARLDSFGGDCYFVGKHVQVYHSSVMTHNFAVDLDRAIANGDLDDAAGLLAKRLEQMFDVVKDDTIRRELASRFLSHPAMLDKLAGTPVEDEEDQEGNAPSM